MILQALVALHAALELQLTAERADQPMHTPMDEGNDSPEERGPEAAGSDSGASNSDAQTG